MKFLDRILRRNSELESMFDFDLFIDDAENVYLRKLALEININFLARVISQTDFRVMEGTKRIKDDWHYLLNVQPNKNQNATEFWQKFIQTLIYKNEALAVLTDTDDLVIADSFSQIEYALFPNVFKDVVVGDYKFKRTFSMDEVIYLTYNNENLNKFMKRLFDDVGTLHSRLQDIVFRNNQIRGTVSIEGIADLDPKKTAQLQSYMDKLFAAFKNNSVAIIPELKGFKYNEVNQGKSANSNTSVEELTKLKKSLIDDVAKVIGIPPALIHGEMADLESNVKAFLKFCSNPLLKKIKDELNAKTIAKKDFLEKNKRIEVFGVMYKSVTENSEAVDKLVASGAYTRNEVREKFGDERSNNPALDKYVMTKNYALVEGGDEA